MGLFGTYAIYAKSEKALADADAAAIGGYVKFHDKWVTKNRGGADEIGSWAVYPAKAGNAPSPPPPAGSSKQQGQTVQGSLAAAGPQAMAAVQANQPTITGGGQGFQIGAVQAGADIPLRAESFLGVDTLTPDNKLDGNYSPRSINWDSFRRVGSRCVRSGVAKLDMDAFSATASGGGSLSSEYRGLSLCALPASHSNADQLLMAFHDKDADLGTAPGGSNSQTSLHIMDAGPRWGRPRNLTGMKGPTLALSDLGSQVMRVNAVYDAIPTAETELRKQSVVAIIVRYYGPASGAGPLFPVDPDGDDGIGNATTNVLFKDRVAWTGASTNYDTGTLTAGKYWVAAWAVSREGVSDPSFASLTVA